jgi:hypothetical protein
MANLTKTAAPDRRHVVHKTLDFILGHLAISQPEATEEISKMKDELDSEFKRHSADADPAEGE